MDMLLALHLPINQCRATEAIRKLVAVAFITLVVASVSRQSLSSGARNPRSFGVPQAKIDNIIFPSLLYV